MLQILKDLTADWDSDFAGQIGPDTLLIADLDSSRRRRRARRQPRGLFQRRDLSFEKLLMHDGRYVEDLTVRQVVDFPSRSSRSVEGGTRADRTKTLVLGLDGACFRSSTQWRSRGVMRSSASSGSARCRRR